MKTRQPSEWIEQQEEILQKEINLKKTKNKDTEIMKHFLFILALTFMAFHNSLKADLNFNCPSCKKNIHFQGIWGGTWICPNSNCAYENYDAIRYCGICGTDRYRDQ